MFLASASWWSVIFAHCHFGTLLLRHLPFWHTRKYGIGHFGTFTLSPAYTSLYFQLPLAPFFFNLMSHSFSFALVMLVPRLWLLLTSIMGLYFFSRLGHVGNEAMASSHIGPEPLLFFRALVMLVLRLWLLLTLAPSLYFFFAPWSCW